MKLLNNILHKTYLYSDHRRKLLAIRQNVTPHTRKKHAHSTIYTVVISIVRHIKVAVTSLSTEKLPPQRLDPKHSDQETAHITFPFLMCQRAMAAYCNLSPQARDGWPELYMHRTTAAAEGARTVNNQNWCPKKSSKSQGNIHAFSQLTSTMQVIKTPRKLPSHLPSINIYKNMGTTFKY